MYLFIQLYFKAIFILGKKTEQTFIEKLNYLTIVNLNQLILFYIHIRFIELNLISDKYVIILNAKYYVNLRENNTLFCLTGRFEVIKIGIDSVTHYFYNSEL